MSQFSIVLPLNTMIPFIKKTTSIFFFFLVCVTSYAQLKVPSHGGVWVHDQANVLSPAVIAQIEGILKAERDSTSNQIAVLIVPSLEGEDIDGYAVRVFQEWKLGQEKKDNGALFLVSIQDRKMRIEVGYGLEGVLTDALSSRINRNQVAPNFRTGNYDQGILTGSIAIIQAIKGQYVNTDPPQLKRKRGGRSPWSTVILIIIIIAALSRKKGGGGGMGGYWAAGALLGGGGFGGSSSSWGSGSDSGGGGFSGGGGSGDSW